MRCNVCYLPIHDETTKILCPRCTNEFHRDHLAAWLLTETKCPMCREVLSEDFREDLKPKSEKERKRLVNIMRTLDNLSDNVLRLETSRTHGKRVHKMRMAESGDEKGPSLVKPIATVVFFSVWIIILIAAIFAN